MRNLCFGTLYVLFVSVMLFLPEAQAAGTNYYVAPNGSGSSCTRQSPCSLDTGLSTAGPGDEVVLEDGVYRQFIKTKRDGTSTNPITIRAENMHKAIIQPSNPGHRKSILDLNHNHTIFRGIVLDGSKKVHIGLRISPATREIQNIVFENNIVRNMGGTGFSVRTSSNVIIRHNLIESTGYYSSDDCCGSAFYIGTPGGKSYKISNLEMYGNIIRDATNNAIDLKGPVNALNNISIHHNLIEKHTLPENHGRPKGSGGGNDGLIIMIGRNMSFHDNIVRDSVTTSFFRMYGNANNKVRNNVVLNSRNSSLFRTHGLSNLQPSEATGNIFCNLSTYKTSSNGTNGINIHDNKNNASQSACDTQVKRILDEMAQLTGKSSGTPAISPPSSLHLVGTK